MNRKDQLWEQQDKLIGGIDFVLRAYEEDSQPNKVVTEDYPTVKSFIGQSVLIALQTNEPGFTMQGENGETIMAQHFSGGKQLWTYIKDGKIVKYEFMVLDTEIDTPLKKLDFLAEKVEELRVIQSELDGLEAEDV